MSGNVPALSFAPVTPAHYERLRGWLAAPHVAEWWGEPEIEFGCIVDMVEGRDTTRPYVIEAAGASVGYIQVWFIADHQNASWLADNPCLGMLPPDAVGVDLTIGEPAFLGRGIGSCALRLFAEDLARDGHETIIIDPDPANARAVAAYTKAGFRPLPELLGRSGDSLIMRFERDASDVAR